MSDRRESPPTTTPAKSRFRTCLTGLALATICLSSRCTQGQDLNFTAVRAEVDFGSRLREWDGFGFNYVETAQTRDYSSQPQDYGGLSLLSEDDRREIIDLVFGDDGLRCGLLKMFLDPFHQDEPGGKYDHARTTQWMRYFAREGVKKARQSGRDVSIITTLYGPPAYMTRQKTLRGRDLDPAHKSDLVHYVVDWVRYLRQTEGLPVRYVSLHNEGEDWRRWTKAGLTDRPSHDYNLFWPPEQVTEFIPLLSSALKEAGLADVGVTCGEPTNWYRFDAWGYADAITDDSDALRQLALITSHGFYSGTYGQWFGEHKSAGIDKLRALRPDLHAWVTSTSWSQMDARNIKEHHGNTYTAKVNGIIPWAGIQRPSQWIGGDPNPGSAFTVHEDGSWEVRRGYWFYKQVTTAGQPGMAVVRTSAMDSEIAVIAFDDNGTENPDAFVVVNIGSDKKVSLRIKGTSATSFTAFRTNQEGTEKFAALGSQDVESGVLIYDAPGGSTTTFFAKD